VAEVIGMVAAIALGVLVPTVIGLVLAQPPAGRRRAARAVQAWVGGAAAVAAVVGAATGAPALCVNAVVAWAALALAAELLAADGDRVAHAMTVARAAVDAASADRHAADTARLHQQRLLRETLADIAADGRTLGPRTGHHPPTGRH